MKKESKSAEEALFPVQLGYRLPAEWEKHEATWLAWPHNPETWPDLKVIERTYIEMISWLVRGEKVNLLVNSLSEERKALSLLQESGIDLSRIRFYRIPTCDAWIRDYAPSFLVRKAKKNRVAAVRWLFNAWGRKYKLHERDNQVSRHIARVSRLPVFEPPFVFEGGAVDTNGEGLFLAARDCFSDSNRNPAFGLVESETVLKTYLGAREVLWMEGAVEGDDTDGHVDNVARFVNRDTVFMVAGDADRQAKASFKKNKECLRQAKASNGKRLSVIEIPLPDNPDLKRNRLPASYANFYIANACVLVPIFGCSNDSAILRLMANFFPDREVVGMRSEALIRGLGSIHCLTHEQPAS